MYEINTLHYPNPFFLSHIFFMLDDERGRKKWVRNNALQRIGPPLRTRTQRHSRNLDVG